jgi:hypothetical protein
MTSPADRDLQQEYEIIKYALTFLLSNLENEVIEDMSDYIGETTYEEFENTLTDIVESY